MKTVKLKKLEWRSLKMKIWLKKVRSFFNFWKPRSSNLSKEKIAEIADRYLATYLALGYPRINHPPFRVRHPLVRLNRTTDGILMTPRSGGCSTLYLGVAERGTAGGARRYAVAVYDRMTGKYVSGGVHGDVDFAGRIATHLVEKLFQIEREVEHG